MCHLWFRSTSFDGILAGFRAGAEDDGNSNRTGLLPRCSTAEKRYMLQPPDEAHDVICCHQAGSDGPGSWVIRLGEDTLGERDSLAGAIDLTRTAAVSHRRPAWLLDESGYPLKPMLPWNL